MICFTTGSGREASESETRLVTLSSGNPLALREIYSHAAAAGAIAEAETGWALGGDYVPLGDRVDHLVDVHLERLGEPQWAMVRALSVAGSIPRTLAERLDATALDTLDRHGLSGGDPVMLQHPLYEEAARQSTRPFDSRQVFEKLATIVTPSDGVTARQQASWTMRAGLEVEPSMARDGAAGFARLWRNAEAAELLASIAEPTVADLGLLYRTYARSGNVEAAAVLSNRRLRLPKPNANTSRPRCAGPSSGTTKATGSRPSSCSRSSAPS